MKSAKEPPTVWITLGRRAAELAREQGALASGHDLPAALAAYRRAAEYKPGDTGTHISIGGLERRLGNIIGAIKSYSFAVSTVEEQLKETPGDHKLQLELSVIYFKIGKLQLKREYWWGALTAFFQCIWHRIEANRLPR